MESKKYTSTEEYIQDYPEDIARILSKIHQLIALTAPEAAPCIAYNMPAFKYKKKPLVYFAAFKKHIGFYALPTSHLAFKVELSKYKSGKGSVQFPLDQEMPYDLIAMMVRARMAEVDASLLT
ncbi:MAG: DUF1801 domain-containing protein [Saprospiraceae bacterium]